jgi:hypothetical protein
VTGDAFRRLFLVLAGLGLAGTAVELAMLRHWDSTSQLVPWGGLLVLAVALVLLATRPYAVRAVRVLLLVVAACAALGVVLHVKANYDAGPLDFRYTTRWPAMSPASKWWAAATETVGPAPTLAPLALVQTALSAWFATLGLASGHHRGNARRTADDEPHAQAVLDLR